MIRASATRVGCTGDPVGKRVPERALRAGLGELAQFFVDGQRVVPDRATALGFRFRYGTAEAALENLLAASADGASVARTPS